VRGAENFTAIQIRAFAALPVFYQGKWVGIINVTAREPRVWREDELTLLRETAARVAAGSHVAGRHIRDLPLGESAWIGAIVRDGDGPLGRVSCEQSLRRVALIHVGVGPAEAAPEEREQGLRGERIGHEP
jgi:hypothetical protein